MGDGGAAVRRLGPGQPSPGDHEREGDSGEDGQRPAPASRGVCDRHGQRGRERRADVDAEDVDARGERRPRGEKRSLTATGIRAWAKPRPRPTPKVSAITAAAPGAAARATPKTPISARHAAIARRDPYRLVTAGAGNAKTPMHNTGIVPSRPATACETSRSSWIEGISGPTPTICGRSASPARKSPASRPRRPRVNGVRSRPRGPSATTPRRSAGSRA